MAHPANLFVAASIGSQLYFQYCLYKNNGAQKCAFVCEALLGERVVHTICVVSACVAGGSKSQLRLWSMRYAHNGVLGKAFAGVIVSAFVCVVPARGCKEPHLCVCVCVIVVYPSSDFMVFRLTWKKSNQATAKPAYGRGSKALNSSRVWL